MIYTVQRPEGSYGPYTLEQLRMMFDARQAVAEDVVYAAGSNVPMTVAQVLQAAGSTQSDKTGGVIPYKNPKALIAYYLAVASLIPCVAVLTGIPSFILGLQGLKAAKAQPAIRGQVHAWIGVIGGGGLALLNLMVIGWLFLQAYLGKRP